MAWNLNNSLIRVLSILIAVCMLVCCAPFCCAEENRSTIQPERLQELVDLYIQQNDLYGDIISIGYAYPATGETWYYHPDTWYYSASLYKVPLMMILAEKEFKGELTANSEINGMTLREIEKEVLTYSNNSVAYSTMLSIAEPSECRKMFLRFANQPEDYYTWDFYGGSFFTARFMTEVMMNLYQNSEHFPGIIEQMKDAQPGHYFGLKIGEMVDIAQKYGSYHDENDNDWNHTAGIIFSPNPFVLTVLTRYGGISETIIGDFAALFYDYTMSLDSSALSVDGRVD